MSQPHLIIYIDSPLSGLHTHIFESTADLSQLQLYGVNSGISGTHTWDEKTSSFVILSGKWQFFKDKNFGPAPLPPGGLGPGLYHSVETFGIDNDSISSVRVIALTTP
jgi:Beta/Gamma crystallin